MASLSPHPLLLSLLLLPLLNKVSSQYTNISLGSTLTPLTDPWLSPSSDFAFGFLPLETNSSLFLLAVYFNKIPSKTIIWTANGANPDLKPIQSRADRRRPALSQRPNRPRSLERVCYASMLDSGNFILSASDSSIIWQTLNNPTDTIMPGQSLSQGSRVFAKLMNDDYSIGRFLLSLQPDGNLVMYAVSYPTLFAHDPYFATMTFGTGMLLVFNETGSMYLAFPNNTRYPILSAPNDVGNSYMRATLDPDGVFRQYSFPKTKLNTGTWIIKAKIPSGICNQNFQTGSGSCGFNSYCIPDAVGYSNCQCPPNYSLIDPARKYKGCKPDFAMQTCELGGEASFNFSMVLNVDWPLSDAEELSPMNVTECQDNCLKDCFCMVAIYDVGNNNGTCWKKKLPLSNGRLNSGVNRIAYIKFSTVNSSMLVAPEDLVKGRRDWKAWALVASSILSGSVVVNIALIVACCFVYARSKRGLVENSTIGITGPVLRSFTYKELEEATKGFSEELGKGAFATVYKGVIPSRPITLIAVKKLEESLLEEAAKDFENEVATIGRTHHKNLVRLLGFCKEGPHRLMVFEFMSKGSLNRFLFGGDLPEWNQRVQIALGIASGLSYLHEECRTPIIHCDIKPQNILLDENLEARISDFGLAKLLKLDQTRTSTGIRGTIGYFAPEWFKNVAISSKVDVYSFGVMLLEMICCRRNFEWGPESQEKATVIDWAKECYRNGRLDLLVEDDEEAKRDGMRLERFVMVGICCIQDEPWLRPSMKKVVQMLEGAIAVSIPPNMYSVRM